MKKTDNLTIQEELKLSHQRILDLENDLSEYEEQNEQLEESVISYSQRISELIDGNKCTKEELKLVMDSAEKRAIKYQDRIAELEDERDKYKKMYISMCNRFSTQR